MKLCAALAIITALAACSSKQPDKQPEARREPPAPAAPAAVAIAPTSPPAAPTLPEPVAEDPAPADFPSECVQYAALIDKLKTCDKLGAARDSLALGYNGLRSAWGAVPAEQRAGVAEQCKTQMESLRSAAAATCGW